MPDITELVKNWWKKMLAVVVLSIAVVGVITFLKPRLYLSVATAVPASSVAADKSKIFNENIQVLYSSLGSTDDLDLVVGTANLDTVYLAVTDEFNLFDHYKMDDTSSTTRTKAAARLRGNSKVMKSEYGELKVKVWDTDKGLAPQLANAIMNKLQRIHENLQGTGNEAALKGLVAGKQKLQQQLDSTGNDLPERKNLLQNQVLQYDVLIGEYQLMVDSKPPVLITVEDARPAARPDKPRRLQVMTATAVLSFLFALFAALLMERRKTT
ncbi:MAG: hypothetical protein H7Y01_14385 [Ferruginibacter sp.]|nr:hypothetical protein [Chitinophagaceae bacterium]